MSGPIAVTGATGQVGRAVVDGLRTRGVPVIASGDAGHGDDVTRRPLDFFDAATFAPFVAGAKAVFLVRPPHIGDVGRTLCPFVDVAVDCGVERVVFLSVDGAATRPYLPHAKVEAHLVAGAAQGLRVGLLRPTFFAQNLVTAYRDDIVHRDRVAVCAGRARVAFVDTNDLGALGALALVDGVLDGRFGLDAPALTGPEALDFEQVAHLLADELGRPIAYDALSIPTFLWRRRRGGDPWVQAVIVTALHAGLRRGDAERVTADLATLLGRPATPLAMVIHRLRDRLAKAT